MTLDIPRLVDYLKLDLGGPGSPLDRAAREERPEDILAKTSAALVGDRSSSDRRSIAILHVLARALVSNPGPLAPAVVTLVLDWIQANTVPSALILAALAEANPRQLADTFEQMITAHPGAVATVVNGSVLLSQQQRMSILERVARDPRPGVREHFYSLLGKHHRLTPPGSITLDNVDPDLLGKVLAGGIDDPNAAVRQRAIAAAYGLGAVDRLRARRLPRIADDDIEVRQYALVSLGALHDHESLAVLYDRLDHGIEPEITSTIWALARRPDGLDRVLKLAGDPRPWIENELLAAFAEVSAPMTDAQIDVLRRNVRTQEFALFRDRHLARTRCGAPELGPDARFSIVGAKPIEPS